jgi:hypothetical protein
LEIFKFIECDNRYLITDYGRVFKNENGIFVQSNYYITKHGYVQLPTTLSGVRYVHRLVAIYFVENTRNLNEVNHIDGNPGNNRLDNLEWMTQGENSSHAHSLNLVSGTYTSCAISKIEYKEELALYGL